MCIHTHTHTHIYIYIIIILCVPEVRMELQTNKFCSDIHFWYGIDKNTDIPENKVVQ